MSQAFWVFDPVKKDRGVFLRHPILVFCAIQGGRGIDMFLAHFWEQISRTLNSSLQKEAWCMLETIRRANPPLPALLHFLPDHVSSCSILL
jgi:hypothetical protein